MLSRTTHHLALSLPVLFLKERKTFIAYTPALDLSASGSTQPSAQKNFDLTLKLFVEELVEAGTLERVLKDSGWSKQERKWRPPVDIERVTHIPFTMPAPA